MKKLFWGFFLLLLIPARVFATAVLINELLANPAGSDTDEWIELYSQDKDFSSADYWIDDDNVLVVNDAVQTGGDDPGSDPVHLALDFHENNFFVISLSSYLNNTGDHPTLFLYQNGIATVIDDYQYATDPGDDITLGRWPDGGAWVPILSTATKGFPNSSPPTPTPIPPTATPTPVPTSTIAPTDVPTSSPTPTTAAIATTIPTIKPTVRPTPTEEPLVLGEETSEPTVPETIHEAAENQTSKTFIERLRSLIPAILIVVGAALTIGSGVPLVIQEIRSRKKPV